MNEILARGRRAENVLRDTAAMLRGLADTQKFLDPQNLRRIERWGTKFAWPHRPCRPAAERWRGFLRFRISD